jgi:hypothetical protein
MPLGMNLRGDPFLETILMPPSATLPDPAGPQAFVDLVGRRVWRERLREIGRQEGEGPRAGKAMQQRHAIEVAIEKLLQRVNRPPTVAECRVAALAGDAARLADSLDSDARDRLIAMLRASLTGEATLIAPFHLLRTAAMQESRGFDVNFAGLAEGAPFDLLVARGGDEAEIACDVISAEEGRGVHRGAWFRLADRIDPDLQTWLAAHPGRYLLKMTLPQGLQGSLRPNDAEGDTLATLHGRIRTMLETSRRADQDEAVVLRLDPLLLAGSQADELGLVSSLRREFGPEAHLSVTAAGGGVFVMAARAGRENEVAAAVRRRLDALAPARLTGARPGILAMFVEDTDRTEWRGLRDRLELEGEMRQFLTHPEARTVVAVTCASRLELFGMTEPDAAPEGELRFRNPAHPAAKAPGLAPAVLSSL